MGERFRQETGIALLRLEFQAKASTSAVAVVVVARSVVAEISPG